MRGFVRSTGRFVLMMLPAIVQSAEVEFPPAVDFDQLFHQAPVEKTALIPQMKIPSFRHPLDRIQFEDDEPLTQGGELTVTLRIFLSDALFHEREYIRYGVPDDSPLNSYRGDIYTFVLTVPLGISDTVFEYFGRDLESCIRSFYDSIMLDWRDALDAAIQPISYLVQHHSLFKENLGTIFTSAINTILSDEFQGHLSNAINMEQAQQKPCAQSQLHAITRLVFEHFSSNKPGLRRKGKFPSELQKNLVCALSYILGYKLGVLKDRQRQLVAQFVQELFNKRSITSKKNSR